MTSHSLVLTNIPKEYRPIIFIAHSYGGIILKQVRTSVTLRTTLTSQALALASSDEEYKDIQDATCAIIFLGTPHQGSGISMFGSAIALLTTPLFGSNKMLMRALQRNSTDLSNLHESFTRKLPDNILVVSLFETKATTIFGVPLGLVCLLIFSVRLLILIGRRKKFRSYPGS